MFGTAQILGQELQELQDRQRQRERIEARRASDNEDKHYPEQMRNVPHVYTEGHRNAHAQGFGRVSSTILCCDMCGFLKPIPAGNGIARFCDECRDERGLPRNRVDGAAALTPRAGEYRPLTRFQRFRVWLYAPLFSLAKRRGIVA